MKSATDYCYGALAPRHGIRTVAELEAEGWTKSNPHPWYKDTWFMKKEVVDDEAD